MPLAIIILHGVCLCYDQTVFLVILPLCTITEVCLALCLRRRFPYCASVAVTHFDSLPSTVAYYVVVISWSAVEVLFLYKVAVVEKLGANPV